MRARVRVRVCVGVCVCVCACVCTHLRKRKCMPADSRRQLQTDWRRVHRCRGLRPTPQAQRWYSWQERRLCSIHSYGSTTLQQHRRACMLARMGLDHLRSVTLVALSAGVGHSRPPRVCILGGGFGGLYAAVRLEGLMWPRGTKPQVRQAGLRRLPSRQTHCSAWLDLHFSLRRCMHAQGDSASAQVTLVDKSERFVFKPLLYELINGAARLEEVAPRYSQLLGPYTTSFVQVHLQLTSAFTKQLRERSSPQQGRSCCGL